MQFGARSLFFDIFRFCKRSMILNGRSSQFIRHPEETLEWVPLSSPLSWRAVRRAGVPWHVVTRPGGGSSASTDPHPVPGRLPARFRFRPQQRTLLRRASKTRKRPSSHTSVPVELAAIVADRCPDRRSCCPPSKLWRPRHPCMPLTMRMPPPTPVHAHAPLSAFVAVAPNDDG